MKKILLIIGLALFFIKAVRSQPVQPNITNVSFVNQLCPDFVFDTLINYKKEKLAIADLKGKFVIIDFWGTFCLPCIADFPKLESLQKKYSDSLQILLVAADGYQKAKLFYETRAKAKRPMYLPCAINRKFVKYFQVKEVSTYVWIDDQGYIKAITDYSQITAQNVADFINRKNLQLRNKQKEVIIDHKKYLVTVASEMDSSSVMYNSSLTKYLKGVSPAYYFPRKGIPTKVYARNMPIRNLYQIAFGDSMKAVPFNRTVIESAHPEKIACPKEEDFETWKVDNTFCYELTVPAEMQKDILLIMRENLNRLFGLHVYLEYRTKNCLVLKKDKEPHFFSDKTATPKKVWSTGGITVMNYPFAVFADMIQHYNPGIIVLDETGITGNIDLVIQAEMNDVDSLNKALEQHGLHLYYEDRQVQMLVIKDPLKPS
jgi:thiol-disulfide isomerase/thioredoxin